jgi:hypothetical protein
MGVSLAKQKTTDRPGGRSARATRQPPKGLAWAAARAIAPKIVAALQSIRPAEARILRRQAALLAWLHQGRRYRKAGTGSGDAFAREILQISASTAKQRRRLDRILRACPVAEVAFLEGRLSACKVLALAPALEAQPGKAERWVERARRLGVRALRRRVKKECGRGAVTEPLSAVSFDGPAIIHTIFAELLELGRMQMGYNAPPQQVIEMLVAEAGYADAAGELPEPEPRPVRKRAPVVLEGSPRPPSEAIARVVQTIEELAASLELIDAVSASGPPADVDEAIEQFDALRDLEKPLRLFQARLLRDLRATRALHVLGHRNAAEFVETRLGVSERTARNMVADAELFEDIPSMEQAYLANRLSLGKAHWVRVLTHGFGDEAFSRRAGEVTHRQLEREGRFLLRLQACFPDLASRHWGPLPRRDLEEALVEGLKRKRWTSDDIELAMMIYGVEPIEEGASRDPAENPMAMRRLETLLDFLVSEHWAEPPGQEEVPVGGERQTFARQRTPSYLRLVASREAAADLRVGLRRIREQLGPGARDWQAAVVLFAHVCRQWSQEDPESRPKHGKVFGRDRYLCQAPGCPKREDLQGHHGKARSRGGGNELWNLITLCFGDHQGVIHEGYAKVSGRAPQALRWELGCRPGREPLLILRGERIVGGSRASRAAPPSTGGGS